jgi:hypothetical protein
MASAMTVIQTSFNIILQIKIRIQEKNLRFKLPSHKACLANESRRIEAVPLGKILELSCMCPFKTLFKTKENSVSKGSYKIKLAFYKTNLPGKAFLLVA